MLTEARSRTEAPLNRFISPIPASEQNYCINAIVIRYYQICFNRHKCVYKQGHSHAATDLLCDFQYTRSQSGTTQIIPLCTADPFIALIYHLARLKIFMNFSMQYVRQDSQVMMKISDFALAFQHLRQNASNLMHTNNVCLLKYKFTIASSGFCDETTPNHFSRVAIYSYK